MKGDPDGNLRLEDTVSRAEFTKIAVASSKYKNNVATNLTISPFKDVLYTHWAAPYIKIAVSNNICKGYPNATFDPDGTVLFEEAVTMLLKVLGYTDDDFGISWPYGQTGLADNLEITKNVDKGIGDALTRGDVAKLVYNTLDTKMKNLPLKLITIFDCLIIENVTIIATSKEDNSVGDNKVLTTAGVYEYKNFDPSQVGKKGDLIVKNGEDYVAFTPSEQTSQTYNVTSIIGSDLVLNDTVLKLEENLKVYYKSQVSNYKNVVNLAEEGDTFIIYSGPNGVIDYAVLLATHSQTVDFNINQLDKYVVYSKLDNAIAGYRNGTFHQIDLDDGTTAYKDKVKTTYAAIKSILAMGDILYVKNDGGDIDYISYEKGNIDGPVTVTSASWSSSFNMDSGVKIMRDGNKVSESDIKVNDIVYYSKDLNMVLGYSAKITGIYEKAIPNKDMPTSIVISGVTYSIESVEAFNKLSSSGIFGYGDTVTVMLGKTNQIAGVMSAEVASGEIFGYLFETGKKEFTKSDLSKYTQNYIKIALPDGGTYEYTTDKDYDELKNSIVKVSFTNGNANASAVKAQTKYSGTFNWNSKKLGSFKVASDVDILDVISTNKADAGNFTAVFPQRINSLNISARNILYADTNDSGEITSLILNNVTGDAYKYGIINDIEIKKTTKFISTGTYTFDIGGKSASFTKPVIFSVYKGQPAKFIFAASGILDNIQTIERIEGGVSKVTNTAITVSGKDYLLSDNVYVYKKSFDNYSIIPLQDIIDNKTYILEAYCDKQQSSGGRVRIIYASEK